MTMKNKFIKACILIFITVNSIGFSISGDLIVGIDNVPGIMIANLTIGELIVFTRILPDFQLRNPRSIVHDSPSQSIFWNDIATNTIEKYSISNGEHETFVENINLAYSQSTIEVDSLNRKLYWVDDGGNSIYTKTLDGETTSVYIQDDATTALFYDLTVEPVSRYMYTFSIPVGDFTGNILERISLDDPENRQLVANYTNVVRKCLTISKEGKLYWYDSGGDQLLQAELDGTNVVEVTSMAYFVTSVQVYKNYLYFSSVLYQHIGEVDIGTGEIIDRSHGRFISISIYDGYYEPHCDPECLNDGECTINNSCQCHYGFGGPACKRIVGYCPCE